MKRQLVMVSLVLVVSAVLALAQSNPVYIQFRPSAVKGLLYKPDSGPAPHVGILNIHRTANVLDQVHNAELAKRGFLVLAMNTRFDNNDTKVNYEELAFDVKTGIEFLRKQPGITKVVLFGGSDGGATVTFYQATAEHGPAYCQGPHKLVPCGNNLAGLPRADGIIVRDPTPGNSVTVLRSLNPAVVNETDPHQITADLDPFNPKNGFNANGPSKYSKEFKQKYFMAQAERMNRLIDAALGKMERMKQGKGAFPDDDVFLVIRGDEGRLLELDPSIHGSTVKPQKLLKNDGTIVTQIVETVRQPVRGGAARNAMFNGGAKLLTVRSFLSANAIRATDSMDGIDWCSSNNSVPCAVQNISVPILFTGMQAAYFFRDNEIHYELAASKDKDFIVIEGATHGTTPCTECETSPGQYSNTVRNFSDYVRKWINARF